MTQDSGFVGTEFDGYMLSPQPAEGAQARTASTPGPTAAPSRSRQAKPEGKGKGKRLRLIAVGAFAVAGIGAVLILNRKEEAPPPPALRVMRSGVPSPANRAPCGSGSRRMPSPRADPSPSSLASCRP